MTEDAFKRASVLKDVPLTVSDSTNPMKLRSTKILWGIFHAVSKLLDTNSYKGSNLEQYLKEIEDGVKAIRMTEGKR